MSTFGGARVIALLSMDARRPADIKLNDYSPQTHLVFFKKKNLFLYQECRLSCHEAITGHITGHSTDPVNIRKVNNKFDNLFI